MGEKNEQLFSVDFNIVVQHVQPDTDSFFFFLIITMRVNITNHCKHARFSISKTMITNKENEQGWFRIDK